MTDTQEKKQTTTQTPTAKTQETTTENNQSVTILNYLKNKINGFFSSWKVRLTLIISLIISILIIVFFWQHLVAVWGMKQWSARAGATPISCMIKDTDNNQYISCNAMKNDQSIPLECGTNILNLGCRVNYGVKISGTGNR